MRQVTSELVPVNVKIGNDSRDVFQSSRSALEFLVPRTRRMVEVWKARSSVDRHAIFLAWEHAVQFYD